MEVGILLWERKKQPEDWGYVKEKDVSSKGYQISNNVFSSVEIPLKISDSDSILIYNDNQYNTYKKILMEERLNKYLSMIKKPLSNNKLEVIETYSIPPLPDGIKTDLSADQLKGRQYILMDEWGPYDFQSPSIWLREINGNQYTFLLLGPSQGNYKIVGGEGWEKLNRVSGAFPATLIATKKKDAEWLTLDLEFIGEPFNDRFGNFNKKGKSFPFNFRRFEKKLNWEVKFYNYEKIIDPIHDYNSFKDLKNNPADKVGVFEELYFAWWDSPGVNIKKDKFATFSETEFVIEKGRYKIFLTSDDGAKLFLDGKLLIDNWSVHEPVTHFVEVELGGNHTIEIEHFDDGGFATLGFRLDKI